MNGIAEVLGFETYARRRSYRRERMYCYSLQTPSRLHSVFLWFWLRKMVCSSFVYADQIARFALGSSFDKRTCPLFLIFFKCAPRTRLNICISGVHDKLSCRPSFLCRILVLLCQYAIFHTQK